VEICTDYDSISVDVFVVCIISMISPRYGAAVSVRRELSIIQSLDQAAGSNAPGICGFASSGLDLTA